MGCNGSESHLIECLPDHNCARGENSAEDAGVRCLRKGMDDQILS